MTTRSTSRMSTSLVIIALAGAFASGPVIGQEPKPKPPAPPDRQAQASGDTDHQAQAAADDRQTRRQKPATPAAGAGPSAAVKARLRTPAKLKDVAPATFKARFDTSAGPFVIEVHRDWAPKGADRFYNLVKYGFFDGVALFPRHPRVHGAVRHQRRSVGHSRAWREANIQDDPVKESNKRGYVTFAQTRAPNSRTTQVFINFADNSRLDPQGFAPFGVVLSGMEVVDKINPQYGGAPSEEQPRIQSQGNAFLNKAFPKLDYVNKATIEK